MKVKWLVILVLALLFVGCKRPATETAGAPSPEASPLPTVQSTPLSDFEEALRFVRNGQFIYIWVITRKDGKPFTSEDTAIFRTKAPNIVDFSMTNDKK